MFLTTPIVVVSGVRIPQARQNGILLYAKPLDISTFVAREAVIRSGIKRERFGSVHWGVMYQVEGSSVHLAKQTAVAAGLPVTVPAMLANRLCCSGLEALVDGARSICLGEAEVTLAGSTDCISRAAALSVNPKQRLPDLSGGEDPVTASTLDGQSGKRMGELVECFAHNRNIARTAMDDFAFESRQRAAVAQKKGLFRWEIVPLPPELLRAASSATATNEDHVESRWPRRESLTCLRSPYGKEGRVTRGNSSTFADGAAAVVLASPSAANGLAWPVLACIRSWAITAAACDEPGEALASAISQALCRAEISIEEIDWFELEEAFAANCVYAMRSLALPVEKINPHGGALALGHAPATSGLRQLLCAAHGLRERGQKLALIGLSAGASQAMALVIENVS